MPTVPRLDSPERGPATDHAGRRSDPWEHDRYGRYRPPVPLAGSENRTAPLDICFLIGSLDIGGGTYVILQHALEAHLRGDRVTLVPLFPPTDATTDWHPALREMTVATMDEVGDRTFDLVVATWWRTVYELHRVRATRYVYFVQSIESRFYAPTEPRFADLAAATYDLPLSFITISPWMQAYLAIEHRQPSVLVPNGIDKGRFNPFGPRFADRPVDGLRVLVEGPVDVAMKQVPETIEAVRDTKASELWLLTSSELDRYPGVDRVFSRVPTDVTPGIYRSCDVLVKLSRVEGMFGPPLEMMHCGGTAVVWDVTGHEDYLVNDHNSIITPTGDFDSVVAAVNAMAVDRQLTRRLQDEALRTAAGWPGWETSSGTFHRWLSTLARHRQPGAEIDDLLDICARRGQELQ
ncbi:MAG: glycosyltransferase family 4 protein [Actinomycetota bacterium]